MKNIKQKLIITIFAVLSLFIHAETGWSQTVGRPHALFEGFMATYLNGAGYGLPYDLQFFDTVIVGVVLNDGSTPANDPIIGKTVEITTTRTPAGVPGTSFNNATIKITDGITTYLSATLTNINFTTDGVQWFLNPGLDINNPQTLNLTNILLNPNGSAYIQELAAALGNNNIAGLQMTLDVFDGDITQNSNSFIQGLFDGVPASTNTPPNANAGNDRTITSEQIAATTVQGVATDTDLGDPLQCRWVEGTTVLKNWTPVGLYGDCSLALSALSLGVGTHTLTLDVSDGQSTSSDNMILTIDNSSPHANAGNDTTITSEQIAATTVQGTATDFDGNPLQCRWVEGTTILKNWFAAGANGECPLSLVTLSFGLGAHTLTLEVSDGQMGSSDSMILTVNNSAPHAFAKENITITSDQVAITTIQGIATDFDGNPLQCRWVEGTTILKDWFAAGINGECPLNLSGISFTLGAHTLTLEVSDGQTGSSDDMILTINNSAPHAAPGGAGVYEINTPVILPGDASDFDGDMLHYEWAEGTNVICSGNIQAVAGGTSVLLPDCVASGLSLGLHTISLQVSDGYNTPDRKSVIVEIIDDTAPRLKPKANVYILWPPNHRMVDIAIAAHAKDNSGLPVTLTATVTSNEPEYGLGSGDIGPDWTQPVIDQNTGMIYLQLRAERSGRGKGRIYTITITATDSSGNTRTAKVKIRVPHDKDNHEREREDREECEGRS
ncbi:MAG: cadherin repeat domain-containing protein [Nitrospirae bacterium]|nr:cadherin repeat domain-containing protein [Nitrospirota bacterium]